MRGANVRQLFASGRVPQGRDEIAAREFHVLAAKELSVLGEEDVLFGVTPNGAGYGDPLRRDPAAVARDVRHGLVSPEAARLVYGVVLTDGVPAHDATEDLREESRRARLSRWQPGPGAEPNGARLDAAEVLHPVADTVDAVRADGGADALRCTVCHHLLGGYSADLLEVSMLHEVSLADVAPGNRYCRDTFVLREWCCPGCGTALACDVRPREAPPVGAGRLRSCAAAGR
jgi:N-methylhydantoinase B